MLIKIATLLLGPLLVLQGKHVRKTTPVLPEAAGERDALCGEGERLRLLIIGDSAAAGVGAEYQHQALSGQLAGLLQERYELQWKLLAKTGATTLSTLKMVQKLEPDSYDVVILSLGVNDVTAMVGAELLRQQQEQLRHKVKSLYNPDLMIVCGVPPMHLFPALPQPLRWYLGKKAQLMSAALEAEIEQDPAVLFVPLDFATDPSMMAVDGFHPGPAAYSIWASNLNELIQSTRSRATDFPTTAHE